MGQYAKHVTTDAPGVQRLEALIRQLPGNARVALTLSNNTQVNGLVYLRPSIQSFRTRAGDEGLNAIVRLRDLHDNLTDRVIWLSDVQNVTKLDSISGTFEA